jgi:hypothetical protein
VFVILSYFVHFFFIKQKITNNLQVLSLTKTYQKYPFISSEKDFVAVDRLTFSVDEGTIFCLLGHSKKISN